MVIGGNGGGVWMVESERQWWVVLLIFFLSNLFIGLSGPFCLKKNSLFLWIRVPIMCPCEKVAFLLCLVGHLVWEHKSDCFCFISDVGLLFLGDISLTIWFCRLFCMGINKVVIRWGICSNYVVEFFCLVVVDLEKKWSLMRCVVKRTKRDSFFIMLSEFCVLFVQWSCFNSLRSNWGILVMYKKMVVFPLDWPDACQIRHIINNNQILD